MTTQNNTVQYTYMILLRHTRNRQCKAWISDFGLKMCFTASEGKRHLALDEESQLDLQE